MPSIPLPEHPSLEHLNKQAKLTLELVREGDEGALAMLAEFHPRHTAESVTVDGFDPSTVKLADAQLAVARLYGFDQWSELRAYLELVEAHGRSPGSASAGSTRPGTGRLQGSEGEAGRADEFVALACLDYGSEDQQVRLDRAREMFSADPSLADVTAPAMATTGRLDRLRAALDDDPELAVAEVGPHRWPLLLYCCYSRAQGGRYPDHDGSKGLACARLLLERGADPDAGFLWNGLVPPFTALTGALGSGEQDQPRHPEGIELARLLLDAGADPNDGQVLYNNGLAGSGHDDPRHLELLVEYGLGTDKDGAWYRRLGRRLHPPDKLLIDELEVAAMGRPNRMRFLIGLGLPLDNGVGRSGATPVRIAAAGGHGDVLAVLAEAGVDVTLRPAERFLAAAKTGSATELASLLRDEPDLVEVARREFPGLVACVCAPGRADVLAVLVTNGFDVNALSAGGVTALHEAATADDPGLIADLVALGADPAVRDAHHGATPLDWARFSRCHAGVKALTPLTPAPDDDQ